MWLSGALAVSTSLSKAPSLSSLRRVGVPRVTPGDPGGLPRQPLLAHAQYFFASVARRSCLLLPAVSLIDSDTLAYISVFGRVLFI